MGASTAAAETTIIVITGGVVVDDDLALGKIPFLSFLFIYRKHELLLRYWRKLAGNNSSNNNKTTRRRNNIVPRRNIAIREIRRLILDEGLSNLQASIRLKIPLRSVQRYVKSMYEQDRQLLSELNGTEELLAQTQIKKERLNKYRQEVLAIARNPNVPASDRIKGYHLSCELEATDIRLLNDSIALISRSSLPEIGRRMMMTIEQEEYVPMRSLREEPDVLTPIGEEEKESSTTTNNNNNVFRSTTLEEEEQEKRWY